MLNSSEQLKQELSASLASTEPNHPKTRSATGAKRRQRHLFSRVASKKQQEREQDDELSSGMSRSSSGCSSRNSVEDPTGQLLQQRQQQQVTESDINLQRADSDKELGADDKREKQLHPSEGSVTDSCSEYNEDEEDSDNLLGGRRHLASAEHNEESVGPEVTTRWRQAGGKAAAQVETEAQARTDEFTAKLVWTNIILFVILHSSLPIGMYMIYTQRPWATVLFSFLGIYASGLGVTGGSHRLWSHRAYKAKWPVQVILVILQTMAGQNSIYTWSRDHRVHHKFAETNADPHNIKRGFFFAHMGWLCCKKHPDVKEKGKLIDMSDLDANPYVMFQHRHFWWMSAMFTVLVPTMIPVLLWGERFWTAFTLSFMVRYLITLHGTWLVNSAAHYYGHRPYDTKIEARESPYVIYNALGEGFHNYHHTFPYDYATSEFGRYMNITTSFIDLCASLGLVEDRRKVDKETIIKRRLRTGDLSAAIGRPKIDEEAADGSVQSSAGNAIHELPYISGLTSMKYTM